MPTAPVSSTSDIDWRPLGRVTRPAGMVLEVATYADVAAMVAMEGRDEQEEMAAAAAAEVVLVLS